MFKKPSIGSFLSIAMAFAASLQAGVARDIASFKGGFNRKKKKSGGKTSRRPYEWGTLGLSQVSEAINKEFDHILSRRDRKWFAKENKIPFKAFYNGPVHGLPKSKQQGRR